MPRLLLLAALTLAAPHSAQAPSSTPDITQEDMRRRIEIVADDSMMGRDTPSPGLHHFAGRRVPILFFTSGTHPDYHQPTDSADRVDTEKASRLVRLLYHPTVAVGDDPARPRRSPEPYREIVQQQ